ncbi:MarR family transcriptional regulator, partial [Tsukamurella sp. 8J]
MGRDELLVAISATMADIQAAHDDRDRLLADRLGVGRTDLRCLDAIVRHGPQTAADLGRTLHLTRGSMTTLVDRLERQDLVERRPDPDHGRRKLVCPTAELIDRIAPLVGHLSDTAHAELTDYTDRQLAVVARFLDTTLARQRSIVDGLAIMEA